MQPAYQYTPHSLTCDGSAFLPMMGEFHYSRYPSRHWERELRKMRAGGISIVASYVIWIHHEEEEGKISFEGDLNLHRFTQLAGIAGLKVFIRIGPWVHAEVRNGGFPDWLLGKPYVPRTNDPEYFSQVRSFYSSIFGQLDGLFLDQGGPIIGIQIENEYGHVGGLSGDAAEIHMKTLQKIARDVGFRAPYWTATGWGGAYTAGMLPVMGGYSDSPWDPRITEIEPSVNFLFSSERNDHAIASDYGTHHHLHFDPAQFPYLTAELGGGLQVTAHRRPIATGKDIEAMTIAKLGSGTSLLGYYMYHGGSNPTGKHSTLQESKATGYPNDLPVYDYDFNAPLGQYGQIRESYRRLRRLALFLDDFGETLAEMTATFPDENPKDPENIHALRHTWRGNEAGGYLFVNNHQRLRHMDSHLATQLEASLAGCRITFPSVDIHSGMFFFWPVNLCVAGGKLQKACATPLCVLQTREGRLPVFYSAFDPAYDWLYPPECAPLTLSEEEAMQATRIKTPEGEHLLLFEGSCYADGAGGYVLEGEGNIDFCIYPPLMKHPKGFTRTGITSSGFERYAACCDKAEVTVSVQRLLEEREENGYRLNLSYRGTMIGAILRLTACYNVGRLYVDGCFVMDHFYTGQDWEIDLERFGWPQEVEVRFTPLVPGSALYLEKWPELPESGMEVLILAEGTPVRSAQIALK